mmetsp:Transcript_82581/g.252364  ORF Transcript_82581/g.252364 Transcript_82581/m.252364 type:complete len:349 (-) Transcript_82581:19-1065(-)
MGDIAWPPMVSAAVVSADATAGPVVFETAVSVYHIPIQKLLSPCGTIMYSKNSAVYRMPTSAPAMPRPAMIIATERKWMPNDIVTVPASMHAIYNVKQRKMERRLSQTHRGSATRAPAEYTPSHKPLNDTGRPKLSNIASEYVAGILKSRLLAVCATMQKAMTVTRAECFSASPPFSGDSSFSSDAWEWEMPNRKMRATIDTKTLIAARSARCLTAPGDTAAAAISTGAMWPAAAARAPCARAASAGVRAGPTASTRRCATLKRQESSSRTVVCSSASSAPRAPQLAQSKPPTSPGAHAPPAKELLLRTTNAAATIAPPSHCRHDIGTTTISKFGAVSFLWTSSAEMS